MDRPRILVIDDEDIVRISCQRALEPEGYDVTAVKSGAAGLRLLENEAFDLVLTDLKMPDMDGIEVLRRVREGWPDTEVILITGYGTVATAVNAMKLGAFDYIEKPFRPNELIILVSRSLERKRLLLENLRLRSELTEQYKLENITGTSKTMQRVFHLIAKVASTGSTVLITGESGTGKELIARAVHYNSPRKDKPFIVVDCGTIPDALIESELFGHVKGAFTGAIENRKGLMELADEGSLFLDEIGNLNLSTQAKLLRVLQEKEFRPLGGKNPVKCDMRFIVATNKNLEAMTKEGTFREDFFYRLNVFPLSIPPLRDRKEDIPMLAYHFLQKYSKETGKDVTHISAETMKALIYHEWPGNVRELENTIQRAIILCQGKTLQPAHLPPLGVGADDEGIPRTMDELKGRKKGLRLKSIEDIEKAFLVDALKRNEWNISRAALDVGMQRTNFHALLKKHNISRVQAKTR
ncbi:MAG: sigma-54 dependent transcriptional regulator [Nitrospirota bacterium]